MYKYILFDFDGTVFDTVEGITKSVRYAVNKIGLDAPLSELRRFAGPPLTDMFMEYFGLSREAAEQAVADFRERYLPIGLYECRVFPGIKELVGALRSAGRHVGIATSKPQELAEELLSREGMLEMFEVISGGRGEGPDCTKQQVLTRAMELLGAAADETVLIGDTKYDVEGARLCSVPCIGVKYGYAAEGELSAAGAAYIAEDMERLRQLLLD